MAWKLWVRGLIAAVVSASSNALALWTVDPFTFNFEDGLLKMGKVALVSGLIGAVLYLKKHPDPWKEWRDN